MSSAYELSFRRKDGSRIQVIMAPRAKFDSKGAFQGSYSVLTDITALKEIESTLKDREKALEKNTAELSEANAALRALIRNREEDMAELEKRVIANMRQNVLPFLSRLRRYMTSEKGLGYLKTAETNLHNIVSPFLRNLNLNGMHLTFMESQMAAFIREGLSTKEIAGILNISERTVDFHRGNLRKKLGLNKSHVGLRAHLISCK